MKLLRAATLTVADLERSKNNYANYFDYSVVEEGTVDESLAASWDAPSTAGLPYIIMAPSSGADIYIRFIEQPPVKGYKALRSYGWAAIEICVQDVLAANERVKDLPFEIIGPPREIEGLPAIHPMQVKGPDEEIVYLTQIKDDLPAYDLPRAGPRPSTNSSSWSWAARTCAPRTAGWKSMRAFRWAGIWRSSTQCWLALTERQWMNFISSRP